jgi:hypothetical protein
MALYPKPPRGNADFEALLDERDHLRIQLSLALDSSVPDDERVKKLRCAVSDAENRIRLYPPA